MNKILHVLVYVFLVLAAAALYFEYGLNDKRNELTERNRMQEDYLVKIARTIEKEEPSKAEAFEIKKDISPVEAEIVDVPDVENVLEDYPAALEQANLETYNWDNPKDRAQMRKVFVLDAEGKVQMDGNIPLKRGPGTEDEILNILFEGSKAQQSRLNSTRAALADLRGKLETCVAELNRIKPEARQDKVTITEQSGKISTLETEKTTLNNQLTKVRNQIDDLNRDIASLKDEVATARDETEAAKEEVAKSHKLIDQLKRLLQESIQTRGAASAGGSSGNSAITSLPVGDKGKVISVDLKNMFAIIEVTPQTMVELKGQDLDQPLPTLEFGVRRPGFNGDAGEFIGRIRLRQEVQGQNYLICDILDAWMQAELAKGDVVFAD